ncbi:hypothetical protein GCM10020260_11250 [Nesterenkonia halobia]|uniref:Uncharacterized protein n=1 Tax=Nesterenkonia halobia TaxID=37922 RepID=A0ABP6RB21_9MICC
MLSLALTLGTVTACADQADEVSVTAESGEELVADWNKGETYDQQVEELRLVNEVVTKHFGEKVLPSVGGGEWDLGKYLNQSGIPDPSTRAEGAYFFGINYDFSDVKANQETQEKALAVLDELGLTPNGDLPTTYDAERRPALYVAGGEDEHGRVFLIEQRHADAGIKAIFWTRHSDDQSMHEAHEANWND